MCKEFFLHEKLVLFCVWATLGIMPRYLFTFVAFAIFLVAYFSEAYTQHVSPETALATYREAYAIKQGVSADGHIEISEVAVPPHVSLYMETPNHLRTLRAFIAPNRGGVSTIYIEQAQPHKFFAIEGVFSVLPETASFLWTTPTTLVFYGTSPDGVFIRYVVDVHSLSMLSTAAAGAPTPKEQLPVGLDT